MSSPYPGNPSAQNPQGGAPQGGSRPPGDDSAGGQWGSPPPAPGAPRPGTGGPPPGSPYPSGGVPPKKKTPWPWILGICGCLLLALIVAAGGGLALFSLGGDDEPTSGPTTEETSEESVDPTDEPTTEEPTEETTTEEPTEEATSEEPTGTVGLPGLEGFEETPVQDPTDADLEASKEAFLGYLTGLSNNDPAAVCAKQMDPITGNGITTDSFLYDTCVETTQAAIDEHGLEGQGGHLTTADFEAVLDAENRVILVHNIHAEDPAPSKIAKGADGQMYVAAL